MPMPMVLQHLEEGRGDRFDDDALNGFFKYHEDVLQAQEQRRAKKRVKSGEDKSSDRKMTESGRFLSVDPDEAAKGIVRPDSFRARPAVDVDEAEGGADEVTEVAEKENAAVDSVDPEDELEVPDSPGEEADPDASVDLNAGGRPKTGPTSLPQPILLLRKRGGSHSDS
jgi:hypothetical protein